MSIKQKLLNTIAAHPKLTALAIGLVMTVAVGAAMGIVEVHSALARVQDQNTLVIPTLRPESSSGS